MTLLIYIRAFCLLAIGFLGGILYHGQKLSWNLILVMLSFALLYNFCLWIEAWSPRHKSIFSIRK